MATGTSPSQPSNPPVWSLPEDDAEAPEAAALAPAADSDPAEFGRADGAAAGSDPARPELPAREPLRPTVSAARHQQRSSRAVTYLLMAGAFALLVGLSFAVGRATAPASAGSGVNGQAQFGPGANGEAGQFGPGTSGAPGFGRGGEGGSLTIQGTVTSVDSTTGTMTVKLSNGSTVQVATTSATTYHGQQAASQADVTAGQTVTVQTSGGAAGSSTRTASDITITSN